MAWLFKSLFYLFGWKLVLNIPKDLKKAAFCVAPHAVWQDFPLGIGARAALGMRIVYLGKEELFKGIFGFIFRALDGIPVKRDKSTNLVESQIKTIKENDNMFFAIAPEGTRKNVDKLKTGFYYMAYGAEIPILMVGFEYPTKSVIITEYFYPTGDFKADMQKYFVPYFKNIKGVQKDWISNYEKGIF